MFFPKKMSFRRDPNEMVYTSLRDGATSPSEQDELMEKVLVVPASRRAGRVWRIFVILLLVLTNILSLSALFITKHISSEIEAAEPEPEITPKSWGKYIRPSINNTY
jgi:hypothetical protein